MKVENTKNRGAEVCLVPGTYDDAHDKAVELQEETGMTFIHPYDDEQVIAGQGTIDVYKRQVEYLITYSLSFGLGMLWAFICGMDGESFRSSFPLMIVYGIINLSLIHI